MAEEEENEEGTTEGAGGSGGSKKKLIMIIGGVVLLLVAVGTPVAIMMMKKGGDEKKTEEHASHDSAHQESDILLEGAQDEDELEEGEEALGAIFPLETFVVNLSEGGYLRAQVQVEFEGRDVPRRFYARVVPIRDNLIDLMASRAKADLLSEKGRGQLKADVKDSINEVLRHADVRQVYFSQFVVQ
jgi:flagellar basal body-associated protein FliL